MEVIELNLNRLMMVVKGMERMKYFVRRILLLLELLYLLWMKSVRDREEGRKGRT